MWKLTLVINVTASNTVDCIFGKRKGRKMGSNMCDGVESLAHMKVEDGR